MRWRTPFARPSSARSDEIELAENLDASQRVVHLDSAAPIRRRDVEPLGRIAGLTGLTLGQPGLHGGAPSVHLAAGAPYVTDVLPLASGPHHAEAPRAGVLPGQSLPAGRPGRPRGEPDRRARRGSSISMRESGCLRSPRFGRAARRSSRSRVTARPPSTSRRTRRVAGGIEVVHQAVESFLERRRPAPDVGDRRSAAHRPCQRTPWPGCWRWRRRASSMSRATSPRWRGTCAAWSTADTASAGIDAFDLFPNTPHVETVMVLSRE